MASFHIGEQHAASINNVGGDMVVGELRAEARWRPDRLRAELGRLERELDALRVRPEADVAIRTALAEAAAEARADGSPQRAASRLGTVARLLADAGALTSAGSALVHALRGAAAALGPAGAAVLGSISAL